MITSSRMDCTNVNRHVQASLMLLSVMDGAELDLNKTTLLSPSTKPNASDDYEKDLQLAAELGRCLLERNQELQNYIAVLQKQIEEGQADIKLLHVKLESTREQLDSKCKQTEVLDATNFDLERELAVQRRENERHQQRIKELTALYDKSRRQCFETEQEFERFRSKQYAPKLPKFSSPSSSSSSTPRRHQRSHSFDQHSLLMTPRSICTHPVDLSSNLKSHLIEFKARLHTLQNHCAMLNEKLQQVEEEKAALNDRLTQIERIHRDETDTLQNELNSYRKWMEKSHQQASPLNLYSPPEHDLSLYDEVLLQSQTRSSTYQTTNYKDLFARVYQKLKINSSAD